MKWIRERLARREMDEMEKRIAWRALVYSYFVLLILLMGVALHAERRIRVQLGLAILLAQLVQTAVRLVLRWWSVGRHEALGSWALLRTEPPTVLSIVLYAAVGLFFLLAPDGFLGGLSAL